MGSAWEIEGNVVYSTADMVDLMLVRPRGGWRIGRRWGGSLIL